MNTDQLKRDICQMAKTLHRDGFLDGEISSLSCRQGDLMIITPAGIAAWKCRPGDLIDVGLRELSFAGIYKPARDHALHAAIYLGNRSFGCIIHSASRSVMTSSRAGLEILPMLDDMAQIVGPSARIAQCAFQPGRKEAAAVRRAMRFRSAVLLADHGALCAGASLAEALAVCQVLEKGCRCFIETFFLGGWRRINRFESALMRFNYLCRYSRAARTNR
jgi:L-fuculose-phosphate aldolase